jgi:hypothetical protein
MRHLRTIPKSVLIFFLFWGSYFLYLWSKILWLDAAGNLIVGGVNVWGDWAAHFAIQSQFAYYSLFATKSPFVIGQVLSYPFVSDWLAGVLTVLGVNFFLAPVLLSAVWSLVLLGALWWFFATTLRSQTTAVLASLLFLLNGGLGFIYFIQDLTTATDPLGFLLGPLPEYTAIESQAIHWISVINSMIIPQRAFVMGFPIALFVLASIWRQFFIYKKTNKIFLMLMGLILGILPLIHTHSFLAVGVILACWTIGDLTQLALTHSKKIKERLVSWVIVAGCTALLAVPLCSYFFLQNTNSHFFTWMPGWYITQDNVSFVVFWLKNWGVLPLIAALGLWSTVSAAKKKPAKIVVLFQYLPYLVLFTLLNLWLFQPFIWDNTKILVWVSVGFSALAAVGLQSLWNNPVHQYFNRALVLVLFCFSTFSGVLDAYRVIQIHDHTYQMYSADELQLAEWARVNTPRTSVWLTSDQHNHWLINLTGRQTLLAFRGWLWTHGYDYTAIEKDLTALFQNPEKNEALFAKYNISYIVIGPSEKNQWGAQEEMFAKLFAKVQSKPGYSIFKTTIEPILE